MACSWEKKQYMYRWIHLCAAVNVCKQQMGEDSRTKDSVIPWLVYIQGEYEPIRIAITSVGHEILWMQTSN